MTESGAEASTLQYAPTPGRKRHRASIIISWTLIAAAVLLIFTFNQLELHSPPKVVDGEVNPNIPMELTARYVVGAKQFLPPGSLGPMAAFMQQLDTASTTTPDHLREAIAAGELEGGTEALARIDAVLWHLQNAPLRNDDRILQVIYSGGSSTLTSTQRANLISRYGWFGHLALGFGQSATDPDRQIALHDAIRGFAAIISMLFIVGGAIILGIGLLITALVLYADRKIHPAYIASAVDTAPFLEAFAVYLVGSILIGLLVGRFSGHLHFNVTYLLALCVPVGVAAFWPLWRGVSVPDWRSGLGWHTGTGVFREMFWGITVYIAGLPLIALAALVTIVLAKWSGAQPTHPIVNQVAEPGSALRLYILASVYAPLAEESLFRGALFHHLRGRHGWWFSAIVVSLIFAAIHPQGWAAIPALGMIAMTFAAIREWRGTIIASAAAHALNNGVVLTVLLLATS
jgi:membrane protease YdiL (CAAX protease family)